MANFMFTFTNFEWLEASFHKRECVKIIPSSKDANRCCCGLSIAQHTIPMFVPIPAGDGSPPRSPPHQLDLTYTAGQHWNPIKHTAAYPTDAYGCIEFRGGTHSNKAQYIRLSYDTRPELVLSLLLREWGLERPKLLISVNGGKANFELQPKLKRSLRKGLLKAAKTTGAWIFTGGLNSGVTKHVGDALVTEKSPRIKGGRVVSIGIAPWGIVDKRNELVAKKADVQYHSVAHSKSRFATLNKYHAYFLLVDNGTVGKYGAEIALRRKLEKYISTQRLSSSKHASHFSTPLVCLVIEGGTNTIRSVLEYVTDSPPVPVVVCDGTGRAADLIAFAHKYTGEDGDPGLLEEMRDQLLLTIQKTFSVGIEQAERLLNELVQCVKRKNLITVFRCAGEKTEAELDQVILTALFKAQHLTSVEQLTLALTWNRCDIARKEIFTYGQDWPPGALDQAMHDALVNDRVDFVRLLLENGVNIQSFLTIRRLEDLYNSKHGPANTLRYLIRDVVPRMPKGYQYNLIDIGLVINQLMGSGYKSTYTRRRFRLKYELLYNSPTKGMVTNNSRAGSYLSKSLHKSITSHTLRVPSFIHSRASDEAGSPNEENLGALSEVFEYPFSELIIWAALTKRQEMAKLMWEHGEQAMAKALVTSRLYQAMASEAADDDLDVEIYEELVNYGKVFEGLALELLDFCYQMDDDLTQQVLTASMDNWSKQTCLSLAVIANHIRFLAHPLSQTILADLWMGGLRMRKNPVFKIVLGLLFPPSISKLEFKTREELELMPQTEEEHVQDRDDDSNSSSSSSALTSRRSSVHLNDAESLASLEAGDRVRHKSDMEKMDNNESNGSYAALNDDYPAQDIWRDDVNRLDLMVRKKTRPLKWKKKLYEFYAAPITKFYSHSLAYIVFLTIYTYICLVRTPAYPNWSELYVVACMVSFGCEKLRQIISTEPAGFLEKLKVWMCETKWNMFDTVAILIFLVGFALRMEDPAYKSHARVIYSTDICYWYIRSLRLLGVNKYFGPFVMMIGKMIEHMMYFVVLLLVVLMAFGVSRQSILNPNEDWEWYLIKHVFHEPYFMLYGEVYAPSIYPDECNNTEACIEGKENCGKNPETDEPLVPCHTGRWITPIVMTIYLLVANILLINLLIALFNTIYHSVNAISHQFWNFQRFSIVMEYEEKPILPAPFIILNHLFRIAKYVYRQAHGTNFRFESGLKLFLSKFDLERLFDFEEECVEGLKRGRDAANQRTIDSKVKNVLELAEELKSKMDDLDRWEQVSQENTRNLDFRLQRIEELNDQTASHLAVIHRFMATQMNESLSREPSRTQTPLPEPPAPPPDAPVRPHSNLSRLPSAERDLKTLEPRSRHGTIDSLADDEVEGVEQEGEDEMPEESPKRKASFQQRSFRGGSSEQLQRKLSRHRSKTESSERSSGGEDRRSRSPALASAAEAVPEEESDIFEEPCVWRPNQIGRSHSEIHQGSIGKSVSNDESDEEYLIKRKVRGSHRRRYATVREYTSITDELESLLPIPVVEITTPPPTEVVQQETETLIDAEETDYHLMENLIANRLRRDSHNFQFSLEDLLVRSIRDDSSSTPSESDSKGPDPADPDPSEHPDKPSTSAELTTPAVLEESVSVSLEADGVKAQWKSEKTVTIAGMSVPQDERKARHTSC